MPRATRELELSADRDLAVDRVRLAFDVLPLLADPVVDRDAGLVTAQVSGSWRAGALRVEARITETASTRSHVIVQASTSMQMVDWGATRLTVAEVVRDLESGAVPAARTRPAAIGTGWVGWLAIVAALVIMLVPLRYGHDLPLAATLAICVMAFVLSLAGALLNLRRDMSGRADRLRRR
jgi:hypothetical protein